MLANSATGGILSPRREKDHGFFTVQSSDIPVGSKRRNGTRRNHKTLLRSLHLAPITEREERLSGEFGNFANDNNEYNIPQQHSIRCQTDRTHDRLGETVFRRSKSFTSTRVNKPVIPRLQLLLDTFDDELSHIRENSGSYTPDNEVITALDELPPRPKCKRKVLPPSVTGSQEGSSRRTSNILLKQRPRAQHILQSGSPSNNVNQKGAKQCMNLETTTRLESKTERPQTADNKLRVIHLTGVSNYINNTGVSGLPAILNNLVNNSDLNTSLDLSHDHDMSARIDDSGALSTPRNGESNQSALRGSDLASFYNMWEKSKSRRPFDKNDDTTRKLRVNRSCMCSIQNCAKDKCGLRRNSVLPPIGSTGK